MKRNVFHTKSNNRLRIKKLKLNKLTLFIMILSFFGLLFWIAEQKIEKILIAVAKTEVIKTTQTATSQGIEEARKQLGPRLNNILIINKNFHEKITDVKLNSALETEVYTQLTTKVQESLNKLNNATIKLSLGEILQSNTLSHYGPTISLTIRPEGAVKITLLPKLEAQGINMVAIKLTAQVSHQIGVIVPFMEEKLPIVQEFPLAQTIIVGEVPRYYFQGDPHKAGLEHLPHKNNI
ncbi:MAG: hypothetical protein RLZ12_926 [Bacillota bacterium]|jgi:sporulation protein YunB